ncbi:Hypothetical protein ZAZAV_190 [Cedratvirus Zaza IHUMI]|uniref:Uncharacterized protein n=1 Tax=Cedratvirus Zaza IHUMI TaxID=2126979 RepID=A0A2R8FDS7_9VIRU|nr:Hypothetical protein ZAZAV_190 [Cedratvirus Zaza IHUMI]
MAKSLVQSVLKGYTYERIRDLCFSSENDLSNALDCDWGVWRDKAVADFNISPQFFDLVKTLYGFQRYLQIATYVELSPLSGVRVYKDTGVIEGVYEAYAGYQEAKARKDPEMLLWFANRIKPEQQENFTEGDAVRTARKTINKWRKKRAEQGVKELGGYEYLTWVVKHGELDSLDQVIHDYFTLPEGFSIARDIPFVPFWEIHDKQSALYDLPLQDYPEEEMAYLANAVLACGDTRIVDFFRSILRDRLHDKIEKSYGNAKKSLTLHHKPEQTYGIEVRFFDPTKTFNDYAYMAEIVINLVLANDDDSDSHDLGNPYWLLESQGDITYLTAVISLFPKEVIADALGECDPVLYPLSSFILESYS